MRPLLVLVGQSGTGKSTLARGLVAAGLVELHPTWTTRPPRADEDPRSSDHVFVDGEAFAAAVAVGELVVTVELFGHRYGLPRLPPPGPVGEPPLLLVGRAPLLPLLAPLHPSPLVYALTADGQDLGSRLAARALPDAEHRARDAFARVEVPDGAHRVFDAGGCSPGELLDAVSACLPADLARHLVPTPSPVEVRRD